MDCGSFNYFLFGGNVKEKLVDISLLELLTQEVTKENPEKEKLKKYMKQAGLKYSNDPITRINTVLKGIEVLSFEENTDEE